MKYEVRVSRCPSERIILAGRLVEGGFFLSLKKAGQFLVGLFPLELQSHEDVDSLRNLVGSQYLWVEEIQESEFGTLLQEKTKVAEAWYEKLTEEEKDFVKILGQKWYGPSMPSACCP